MLKRSVEFHEYVVCEVIELPLFVTQLAKVVIFTVRALKEVSNYRFRPAVLAIDPFMSGCLLDVRRLAFFFKLEWREDGLREG